MNSENGLLVRKMEYGTVLDHIESRQSDSVLKALGRDRIERENPDVTIIPLRNVSSRGMGRKDIIKFYGYHISEKDADIICLIFPTITVNYIENWEVKKYSPKIPNTIDSIMECPEVMCITKKEREPVITRFTVLNHRRMLQCQHCDTLVSYSKIPEYIRRL